MDKPLLRNLITGAGSGRELVGGLIIIQLYIVIGLLGAIGSILVFRRMFRGRWEQIFWASFLVVIAGFYLSFAAYFEAPTDAWRTELTAVLVFVTFAAVGLVFRPGLAVGYVLHGLWDLFHGLVGNSPTGEALTQIPLGYDIFCATYDLTVACYLVISDTAWHAPGKFDLYFWRHLP
jgi:hypothetical protein